MFPLHQALLSNFKLEMEERPVPQRGVETGGIPGLVAHRARPVRLLARKEAWAEPSQETWCREPGAPQALHFQYPGRRNTLVVLAVAY